MLSQSPLTSWLDIVTAGLSLNTPAPLHPSALQCQYTQTLPSNSPTIAALWLDNTHTRRQIPQQQEDACNAWSYRWWVTWLRAERNYKWPSKFDHHRERIWSMGRIGIFWTALKLKLLVQVYTNRCRCHTLPDLECPLGIVLMHNFLFAFKENVFECWIWV